MFSIGNTSIAFQTYDRDVGRVPATQTFASSQLLTGGYIFCSTAAVYVRLTVGPLGQQRQLPEFFLPPGAQGVEVDSKSGGNPVSLIEVRAATGSAAQFWGALATETDPIGSFTPASYSVSAAGIVIPPPTIGLTFQQDGVNKAFEQIGNFTSLGGVPWQITDDVPGTRATIPVPRNGFQHNDIGQLNEVILDFEDGGGVTWTLTDDAANNRVKLSAAVASAGVMAYVEFTAPVTVSATTEATATSIVSAGAVVFDGVTPVLISAYIPRWDAGAATYDLTLYLFDGANSIGALTESISPNAVTDRRSVGVMARRLTPSAASHTYSIRGSRGATNVTVSAGAGGAGNIVPGYIKIDKDN